MLRLHENCRLYLKKGEITDVMSPYTCSIELDSGERIEADQHQIETGIPRKEGARVLILMGPHERKHAKMLQRNPDTGQAALRLADDFSIVKCDFSEFAEYVGPLTEDE